MLDRWRVQMDLIRTLSLLDSTIRTPLAVIWDSNDRVILNRRVLILSSVPFKECTRWPFEPKHLQSTFPT